MDAMAEMETEVHRDAVSDIRNAVTSIQELQRVALPLLQEMGEKFQSMDEKVRDAIEGLQQLEAANQHEEANDELNPPTEIQIDYTVEDLSDVTKLFISVSVGPLNKEDFWKFLMEDAWGKPKSEVLPIARGYTKEIKELMEQLRQLRHHMKHTHMLYMNGPHRLDSNLNRRIDRLLANMNKGLEKEAESNKQQTSIKQFLRN